MRSSFKLGNGISMENIDQSRLCQVDGIFVFAFWVNSDGLCSYHINYCTGFNLWCLQVKLISYGQQNEKKMQSRLSTDHTKDKLKTQWNELVGVLHGAYIQRCLFS